VSSSGSGTGSTQPLLPAGLATPSDAIASAGGAAPQLDADPHVSAAMLLQWISSFTLLNLIEVKCVSAENYLPLSGKNNKLSKINMKSYVGFEVSKTVTMKNAVFWDIKTQFVPHRRHITSPLQSPDS
jgi:hypothetical protein